MGSPKFRMKCRMKYTFLMVYVHSYLFPCKISKIRGLLRKQISNKRVPVTVTLNVLVFRSVDRMRFYDKVTPCGVTAPRARAPEKP